MEEKLWALARRLDEQGLWNIHLPTAKAYEQARFFAAGSLRARSLHVVQEGAEHERGFY
jgi:hypothetical protein